MSFFFRLNRICTLSLFLWRINRRKQNKKNDQCIIVHTYLYVYLCFSIIFSQNADMERKRLNYNLSRSVYRLVSSFALLYYKKSLKKKEKEQICLYKIAHLHLSFYCSLLSCFKRLILSHANWKTTKYALADPENQ